MNELLTPFAWSALLMLIGFALIVLEIFLPSGGIIGFLAASAVIVSIVMAFYSGGPAQGVGFATAAVLGVPVMLALAFKYWPHTAIGRRFLLGPPTDEEVLPDSPKRRMLKQLVGKFGTAKTKMLPSGAVLIEGRVIDAVSQGMPIETGQTVKVIEVRANRVVVRALEPGEEEDAASTANADDVLSQPIENLGLDPMEDPLA